MPLAAMKIRLLLSLSMFILLSLNGYSQAMILLEGNYQGKNVYVQNPFASNGVGFCVYEVRVNDNVTTDEIGSNAFEIDLRNHNLKLGDPVSIKIFHKDDCKPKVLNPEVLRPKSTYEIVDMQVTPDEVLKWTTKGESGKLTFIIEQYRWNKWVKIGEVDGVGKATNNTYTFKVTPHSGENKFRVKQIDYTNQPRISKSVTFMSTRKEITFYPTKTDKEINFEGGETMYEIFDQYGVIVKKGFGSKIDVSSLPKGGYFLNYDNKQGQFFKK
jgi:hypothetical protein